MDAHTQGMYELIIRYLNENYPGAFDHMNVELLRRQPYYKQLWTWWQALAYYGDAVFFNSLDDAPEGLESVWIIDSIVKKNYIWKKGKYEYLQQMTKKECKDIYGEKTPGTY